MQIKIPASDTHRMKKQALKKPKLKKEKTMQTMTHMKNQMKTRMKTWIALSLATLACFSSTQAFAALSPKNESVAEMEAVLDAASASDKIAQIESVVNARRLTPFLNTTGKIKYALETCIISKHNTCKKKNTYIVTLDVAENPAIGPLVISVDSIKKAKRRR